MSGHALGVRPHRWSSAAFVHQATDLDGIDALRGRRPADRLHRLRLHRRQPPHRQSGRHHDAALAAADRPSADRADRRRHQPRSATLRARTRAASCSTTTTLAANLAGVRRSLASFLEFGDGPGQALLVNNDDWLQRLAYIDFLRDYGRHFTINRMLTFDSVKLRLEREQPLTFLEFNYMVMQAYDFLELARRHDCRLQMGGSDQWGNIVNGVELGRRAEGRELYGLTTPLITTGAGAKMGKTAQGAVWLNAERLPAFDYWQYWRNVDDADVGRFLRLFTELPLAEIERLEQLRGRRAQRGQEGPGRRGDQAVPGAGGRRSGGRIGARDLRDGPWRRGGGADRGRRRGRAGAGHRASST